MFNNHWNNSRQHYSTIILIRLDTFICTHTHKAGHIYRPSMAFVTALGFSSYLLSTFFGSSICRLPFHSLQPVHNTEATRGNLLFSTSCRLTSHLKNFFSLAPNFLNEPSILLLLSSNIIEASGLSHVAHVVLRVFILEKARSIQYGYRKCGTHARVLSRTLVYGNSKIEIRQLKINWKKARRKE